MVTRTLCYTAMGQLNRTSEGGYSPLRIVTVNGVGSPCNGRPSPHAEDTAGDMMKYKKLEMIVKLILVHLG